MSKKAATYLVRVVIYEREEFVSRAGTPVEPEPIDKPTLATIEALIQTAISASTNTTVKASAERVDA